MAFAKKKLTDNQIEVRAMKAGLPLAKPKELVKKKTRRTLEQKTAAQLMEPADNAYSRYIRLRDSELIGDEWIGQCISCPRVLVVVDRYGKWIASSQNGHFISRGVYSLRFNEFNTNLQCAHCNAWRDKEDMLEGYRKGLALKYGEDTVTELKQLSKAPDAYKRPKKPELLQIIADCKLWVNERLDIA